jgi:hypothetical protein
MLATIFASNERVQVIDHITGIWTEVKVLGIESDWAVRVKWVTFRHPNTVVEIPQHLRRANAREMWNIRKWTDPKKEELQRAGRRESLKMCLPFVAKNCQKDEKIYFMDFEDDCAKPGWIHTNDPFLEQMQVWVVADEANPDSPNRNLPPAFVLYKHLRAREQAVATQIEVTDSEDDFPKVTPPRPRPPKRTIDAVNAVPAHSIQDTLTNLASSCTGIKHVY